MGDPADLPQPATDAVAALDALVAEAGVAEHWPPVVAIRKSLAAADGEPDAGLPPGYSVKLHEHDTWVAYREEPIAPESVDDMASQAGASANAWRDYRSRQPLSADERERFFADYAGAPVTVDAPTCGRALDLGARCARPPGHDKPCQGRGVGDSLVWRFDAAAATTSERPSPGQSKILAREDFEALSEAACAYAEVHEAWDALDAPTEEEDEALAEAGRALYAAAVRAAAAPLAHWLEQEAGASTTEGGRTRAELAAWARSLLARARAEEASLRKRFAALGDDYNRERAARQALEIELGKQNGRPHG